MDVTKKEVTSYLAEVKRSVKAGRYRIEQNEKRRDNLQLLVDYVMNSDAIRNILLSLNVEDFSEKRPNDHPGYEDEQLYIFGKEVLLLERFGTETKKVPLYIKFNKLENMFVIVVSFHKQKYPLRYPFKNDR